MEMWKVQHTQLVLRISELEVVVVMVVVELDTSPIMLPLKISQVRNNLIQISHVVFVFVFVYMRIYGIHLREFPFQEERIAAMWIVALMY